MPPRVDPGGPAVERRIAVAAGVQLLVAVQSHVDEVCRQVLEQGPPACRVRHDERDPVAAQEGDERRVDKARMSNLDGMAHGSLAVDRPVASALHPRVVMASDRLCRRGVLRQQLEERLESGGIESQLRRELPEHGSELGAQAEDARSHEIGERCADVVQLQHVRDVPRTLDGENEVIRRRVVPGRIGCRPLQRIEGAVDFDRPQRA